MSFAKREKALTAAARELEEAKKVREEKVAETLKAERETLKGQARKEVETALQLEIEDLQAQNSEKEKRLQEAMKAELELRKKARELEEQKRNAEVEISRRIDGEREKIRRETLEAFSEEHRLRDLEKDKKIGDMLKTIEELKRRGDL